MAFLLYGKHTKSWRDKNGKMREPDSRFAALDARGRRVSRLDQAMSYATKEDIQEILDRPAVKARIERGEVAFDIRKR